MRSTKRFEDSIRAALSDFSSRVEASDQLKFKINYAIEQQSQKGDSVMKKRFTIKSAAIIAAVVCLTTVTVFAAANVSGYISFSSSKPAYTSFPTEETLQKDFGFVAKTVNTFSNGYIFKDAKLVNICAIDKNGKSSSVEKEISYCYTSGQGNQISLFAHKPFPDETMDPKAVKTDYKGVSLLYFSQKYKFVPENYKMTEEDKRAQKNGEIEYSYGSDTVENSVIQNVIWENDGINYNLMAKNSKLTQTELTAMAKEIVDKSK